MSDIDDMGVTYKTQNITLWMPEISGIPVISIFQLSKPLYSITVDDEENPLSCSYEHGYFWHTGIGYVRLLTLRHSGKPFKVMTLPRAITDIVEAKYTEKDKDYKDIGPWADIALSVIIRSNKRLKGKTPKISSVVGVAKNELKEVIFDDIGVDIRSIARAKAKEAKARC